MADIQLTKGENENGKIEITCRECKRNTRHLILSDCCLRGTDGIDFQWYDEYQIVQCQGCETVSFRKTHTNSEEFCQTLEGKVVNELFVDIYPNPEKGRNLVTDYHILPSNLQRIYSETIKSINSDQPVLTGIGIRAIVETVCKEKSANGNDLFGKINDLVDLGVLTKDGADILHKLRTLGNAAAHEVKPHDNVQLGLALDVIDHLLQGVYILPYHANTKFK
jgi:Domain of unknown function (DUF4145)